MTDEEIDQAVETAVGGIEGEWLERGSVADRPKVEANMTLVQRLGQYAKTARAEIERLRAENVDQQEQLRQVRAIIRATFDLFPEVALTFLAVFERIGQSIDGAGAVIAMHQNDLDLAEKVQQGTATTSELDAWAQGKSPQTLTALALTYLRRLANRDDTIKQLREENTALHERVDTEMSGEPGEPGEPASETFLLGDFRVEMTTVYSGGRVSWKGHCPQHESRVPSLYYFPDTGTYRCVACGWQGMSEQAPK